MLVLFRYALFLLFISLIHFSYGDIERKREILKSIVNTCTACNYVKALIDNNPPIDEITTYLKEQCRIYGKKGSPKEFCENMDEHDLYLDKYLPAVAKYICKGKEKCASSMVSSRPMIEGVIKRLILRGASMIDYQSYCGIDVDSIQMGRRVLDQSNNSLGTTLLCDLCDRFADFLNITIFNINSPIAPPFWTAASKALVPICELVLPLQIQEGLGPGGCTWQNIINVIQDILNVLQVCVPTVFCELIFPQCPKNDFSTCKNLLPTFPTPTPTKHA
uniref:Saposin B-type domain-containing protein n=1 Tax=Acrobeloides nanus TaxID=290746 RepID=A0A914DWY6_9BILA